MSDNTVTLTGNITRDPEVRITPGGLTVVSFGLAVNMRRKDGNEWVDDPNFFDITIFGEMGMNVADSLHKGDRAMVSGRLRWSSWEKDGEKRSKVEVIADEVGPSLRWAITPQIKKTKGGGGSKDPHAQIDAARASLANASTTQWGTDEEPF